MKLTRRQSFQAHLLYAPAQRVEEKTGMTAPGPKRAVKAPERDVLNAVLSLLKQHPKVAWAQRINSGAYKTPEGRYIRFGFPGCSDVIGQMRSGAFLAIETKSGTGRATPEQQAFLERVRAAGGHSGVARSVDDALAILEDR